jgi:tetratricopeptide (TPR) repeat protein
MGGSTPTAGGGGQTSVQANPTLGSGGGAISSSVARPVFIAGKVVMQDGSPVPHAITIQRVCSGVARTVAYTDGNGRFSFQWNDRNTVVADASDAGFSSRGSGGFGGAQSAGGGSALATDPFGSRMMNCELRASAAGYTSDTINLFNRRSNENPDVGMLVLRRIAGVEGVSVSVTSMTAPKEARKAYDRGLQYLLKNNSAEATKDFEKAVALYPKYADAWVNLGKLRAEAKSLEAAQLAFEKAIQADPKLVPPYIELGMMAAVGSKWQQSADYLDFALHLDPLDFPQAWYASAVANFNLAKYAAAENSAREAVKLDPRHVNPRSVYLLGLVLAEKKDYAGAAAELGTYLRLAPNAPDQAQVKDQLGQIEKIKAGAASAAAHPDASVRNP